MVVPSLRGHLKLENLWDIKHVMEQREPQKLNDEIDSIKLDFPALWLPTQASRSKYTSALRPYHQVPVKVTYH